MFGVKPRNAFIGMCISMMGIDQHIDEREVAKVAEVLARYGFSEKEIRDEIKSCSKMSIKAAIRYGQKCAAAITKLDDDMQKKLIQSLTEIAEADEYFHDAEKSLLVGIKAILGKS